ncbi:MAG: hypothetical protein MUQ30_08955 [Anaerolineae bacterium]|nr:hypothetical protein [Anaerolineae bacterium]
MKQKAWFGLGAIATFVLVAAMLLAGWWWGRRVWAMPMGGQMGRLGAGTSPWSSSTPRGAGVVTSNPITLQQAQTNFEHYLEDSRNEGVEVAEVMEFEHNFYAIVIDSRTGVGVAELLADKTLGAVSPEMGPNMMWNAYSMRGGMMGRTPRTTPNRLSEEEALQSAQSWLEVNSPDVQPDGHADPFSGYYTIHTLKDGQIEGMLSVHGDTGEVWYHNWHGDYVGMLDLGHRESEH